jgi:DNA-directed RNA polymerase specialized sigma24 family protein
MAQALLRIDSPSREVLAEEIVEALGKLPRDLREVFVLAHYSSVPLREIAHRKGLEESDLDSLISSANRAFYRTLRVSQPNLF